MTIGDIPSPQPSPAKNIITLAKSLARERGRIEQKLKVEEKFSIKKVKSEVKVKSGIQFKTK